MGDLLSSLPAARYEDAAWVEYYDGDRGLAEGFAMAGDAIVVAWQTGRHPNDKLLLPLMHNYRHAIELALKEAIRQAASCLRLAGRGEPELWAERIDEHLKRHQGHRLAPLADQLDGFLRQLGEGGLPLETKRLIARLHQLDPSNEALRYSGHLTTTAFQVDVVQVATALRDAFDMINDGVLPALDAHESVLQDMIEASLY